MISDSKKASITRESVSLMTYPYSDPSPVPEFGRLYPYNRFDGYTDKGEATDWEMIVMENEYIKLWINPAVGGKIWGAIEKGSGKEFIYFNHAAKFRDVAMRGPWTSGGLETNMGIIGHTPSCSSAVDHHIRENADSSVSCFISATDWPSRTLWCTETLLPANSAAFTTRTWWYNNSGLEQSYYHWTNVGIKTSGNLQYIFPGNIYLGHDGQQHQWPVDEEGRQISWYDKNNFGHYKSYHVAGSKTDFWGCYWHQDNFGLGHYSLYDEKPGKKIWIWGLSRYGMLWEDLLTDTDGQYTEVQSGRLFNQSISSSSKTPFKHYSFLPYTFDSWEEHWFPVKDIGGLTYGDAQLSFYLQQNNNQYQLNICANQNLNHTLKLECDANAIFTTDIVLDVMQTTVIHLPDSFTCDDFKLHLNNVLIYNSAEQSDALNRPAEIPQGYDFDSVQALYIQAKEWERQRFFERAIATYNQCLEKDPFYIEALNGLAGINIKQARYADALTLLKTPLSVNTYHPEANYLYGIVNVRLNNTTDAKDGFSIASLSVEYRTAAFTELAKIHLAECDYSKALLYTNKALNFNIHNQQAFLLQVITHRLQGNPDQAVLIAERILKDDPLNHAFRYELYLLSELGAEDFKAGISSELPYETYLDIAAFYYNLKLYSAATEALSLSPEYAMVSIWQAYLFHLTGKQTEAFEHLQTALKLPAAFVFPHREEDVEVLQWAINESQNWKFKYYLALLYVQMLRKNEALALLNDCGNTPDFYPFYLTRAGLQKGDNEQACEDDLRKALSIAPAEWRTILTLSKYLGEKNYWQEALTIVWEGYQQNTGSYQLGLHLAKCLMQTAAYQQGIELMNSLQVLPNEGASDGRDVWRETHLFAALKSMSGNDWSNALHYIAEARRWPENLGVGKPYEVDERLEDFMEMLCLEQNDQKVHHLTIRIINYRQHNPDTPFSSNDFLTMYLLRQLHKPEQATSILTNWLNHDPLDVAALWSQAFFGGNTTRMSLLSQMLPMQREPLPYEILFTDKAFPFVKELYQHNFFSLNKPFLLGTELNR